MKTAMLKKISEETRTTLDRVEDPAANGVLVSFFAVKNNVKSTIKQAK